MDPNELNNKNQINRIATPIKLDANGQKIEENREVVLVSNEIKKEKKKVHLTLNAILVLVLLLILSILIALICYFIIPEMKSNNINYNEKRSTTTKTFSRDYSISSWKLTDGEFINYPFEVVDSNIKISAIEDNGELKLYVNDNYVDTVSEISSTIGTVDKLILITTHKKNSRTTRLIGVLETGEIKYNLLSLTDDGMLINKESPIQFNSETIIVNGIKVFNNSIILDSTEGLTNGYNMCDNQVLLNKGIGDVYPVIANYAIKYLGDNKFSTPTYINGITLEEYKNTYNPCNN